MHFEFQLTRLMRGVTLVVVGAVRTMIISTHTPHARRDWIQHIRDFHPIRFQLTRLMRGVTELCMLQRTEKGFQLTRLMRGVTSNF